MTTTLQLANWQKSTDQILRFYQELTHGGKELWKPVVGYEGLYEVSSHGRMRSMDRTVTDKRSARQFRGRIKKQTLNRNGRPNVTLHKNGIPQTFFVSKLVLEAFVGPCPPGLECRHFPDPDPTNNNLKNLSWETRQQNEADKIIHGTSPQGEKHGRSILTKDKVLAIRADPRSAKILGTLYNVNRGHIYKIKTRKKWRHI